MPIDDGGEDTCHRVVIKPINADNVKVSGEPTGDCVATTSWRTHPTH